MKFQKERKKRESWFVLRIAWSVKKHAIRNTIGCLSTARGNN